MIFYYYFFIIGRYVTELLFDVTTEMAWSTSCIHIDLELKNNSINFPKQKP